MNQKKNNSDYPNRNSVSMTTPFELFYQNPGPSSAIDYSIRNHKETQQQNKRKEQEQNKNINENSTNLGNMGNVIEFEGININSKETIHFSVQDLQSLLSINKDKFQEKQTIYKSVGVQTDNFEIRSHKENDKNETSTHNILSDPVYSKKFMVFFNNLYNILSRWYIKVNDKTRDALISFTCEMVDFCTTVIENNTEFQNNILQGNEPSASTSETTRDSERGGGPEVQIDINEQETVADQFETNGTEPIIEQIDITGDDSPQLLDTLPSQNEIIEIDNINFQNTRPNPPPTVIAQQPAPYIPSQLLLPPPMREQIWQPQHHNPTPFLQQPTLSNAGPHPAYTINNNTGNARGNQYNPKLGVGRNRLSHKMHSPYKHNA